MFAFSRLLLAAGFLTGLTGLAGGFFGEQWLKLDVLSHFRLHFAGAVLVCLIALAMPRAHLLAAGFGTAALIVAIGWMPASLGNAVQTSANAAKSGGKPLRLVSFNSWVRNSDWRRLQTYLERERADVVVLLEFGPEKQPLLQALRKLYPWQTSCAKIATCRLALLSRHPWREARIERGRKGRAPVIWARFGEQLGAVTIFGTHLTRPPALRNQLRQVQHLGGRVAEVAGPKIVAGDFNATPWSVMFRRFRAKSGLENITGIGPTWPAVPLALPQISIDHVFVSRDIAVRGVEIGPALGSDHLPVVSDLIIGAPAAR